VLAAMLITLATAISVMPLEQNENCSRTSRPWVVKKECRQFYWRLANPPVRFCEVFDKIQLKCASCLDGFILSNNQCFRDDVTSGTDVAKITRSLEDPFAPLSPSVILYAGNPFCMTYSNVTRLCIECHDGYTFRNNDCFDDDTLILKTKEMYLKPDGMMVDRHLMCSSFSREGKCTSCYEGAEIRGDGNCLMIEQPKWDCHLHKVCYPVITSCVKYSILGVCKECNVESINVNGHCHWMRAIPLCWKPAENKKDCVECTIYAHLVGNQCVWNEPYCRNQTATGCSECQPGSTLIQGKCYNTAKLEFYYSEPNCLTWSKGKCVQCKFGWQLNGENCDIPPPQPKNPGVIQPQPTPPPQSVASPQPTPIKQPPVQYMTADGQVFAVALGVPAVP
jgi:hypothetical protein